jgi:hypothetical protein
MKTITAVECKRCGKLIDQTKQHLVAHEIRIMNTNSPNRFAVNLKDEAFCDVACLNGFIKDDSNEIPF